MDNSKLYEDYKNLVYKIANQYASRWTHLPKEDIEQEGFFGLLVAAENFKPDMKAKFSTYAYKYINGYISHYIRDEDWILKNKNISIDATKTIIPSPSPEDRLINKVLIEEIIGQQSKEDIKLFKMYYADKRSLREIKSKIRNKYCQETIRRKVLAIKAQIEEAMDISISQPKK